MKLYFAYGSSVWKTQMLERCSQSRKTGLAYLPDWRWMVAADGYASVIPAAGDKVQGMLFEIDHAGETALDLCEQVAEGACSKRTLPVRFNDRTLLALCYVDSLMTEAIATPEYGQRLLTAFAYAGLGNDHLELQVGRSVSARAA